MSVKNAELNVSEFEVKNGRLIGIGAAGASAVGVALLAAPAQAAPGDGVTEITGIATSLSGVAAACLIVALAPLGIYYAFKIGKRVMSS